VHPHLRPALQRAVRLRAPRGRAGAPRLCPIVGRGRGPRYRGGVTETRQAEPEAASKGERAAADQLDQLRFLHRVARMATTARTWEELLETVVDETRDALRASVSSLYLL